MSNFAVRDAVATDIEAMAQLWFDGWQDAHAAILPAELRRLRTLSSFKDRMAECLPFVRVAENAGSSCGFSSLKGDELYQFYVSAPVSHKR